MKLVKNRRFDQRKKVQLTPNQVKYKIMDLSLFFPTIILVWLECTEKTFSGERTLQVSDHFAQQFR